MVNSLLLILFAIGALVIGVLIAFVPLRALVAMIGRNIAVEIREFIERRRDRRSKDRSTPDRRTVAASAAASEIVATPTPVDGAADPAVRREEVVTPREAL